MAQTRAILAAFRYLQRFAAKPIVMKIDESALERHRADKRLIRDIVLLKDLGLKIALVCNEHSLSICSELLGQVINSTNLDSLITEAWPVNTIPVIVVPTERSEQLAAEIAEKLAANKLIFLNKAGGIYENKTLLHQMTISQAEMMVTASQGPIVARLQAAIYALRHNVPRVHIIGYYDHHPHSIIDELFTSAGVGTMIFLDSYKGIVEASDDQVQDAIEFLQTRPTYFNLGSFVDDGVGHKHWWISVTDDEIDGCLKLTFEPKNQKASIVCLAAANEDFETLENLLIRAFEESRNLGARFLTLDFAHHPSWIVLHPIFTELGFRQQSEKSHVWIAKLSN